MIYPVKIDCVQPYYLKVSDKVFVESYLPAMQEMSTRLWTYFGYSGLSRPWFYQDAVAEFEASQDHLVEFIKSLESNDVSFYSYCMLILPLCRYESYRSLNRLFFSESRKKDWWSWLKKARAYAGSSADLDKVSHFMETYFEQQVQYSGKAYIRRDSVIRENLDGITHFEGYHRAFDRIFEIEGYGISYADWVKMKFENGKKAFSDEINFRALININKLDPDMREIVSRIRDPWYHIKEFLGLSQKCQISDGYIPKGWLPSDDDFENSDKIVEVKGDGFYFYKDGTQRKGKCHYAINTYYGIRCDPSNFDLFKEHWKDAVFLTKRPTWAEYRDWAIHPGIWGEDGSSLSGIVKSVKWRKK